MKHPNDTQAYSADLGGKGASAFKIKEDYLTEREFNFNFLRFDT